MHWEDIVVSSKILGHISAGVYRSTGGALKELVSNAFDASASRVVITTNHPSFDIITCYDNGIGIKLEEFKRLMKEGIGQSTKRVVADSDVTPKLERPIIGRLGIGMLGIAQVCHAFKVVSHHQETKKAFEATVRLVDYLREKVDALDPTKEAEEPLEVGQFTIQEIDYDSEKAGTYIIAADMRAAFVRKFRENPGPPLPLKFPAFLKALHHHLSVKEMGDYWQMVWELAIACPISYIEDPFQWKRIKASDQLKTQMENLEQGLKDYKFEVVIDGLSLHKPNLFPYPPSQGKGKLTTGQMFAVNKEVKVYGRPLKLKGYIYMQDGKAIEPMELRGLLIRIKNVAIGKYDSTFLNYPKIEGPRFNWLSSEIYVEEGLENALNIDRDSFNEINSHFMALRQTIHSLLGDVFLEAHRGTEVRSRVKHQRERNRKLKALQGFLRRELNSEYEIIEEESGQYPLIIDTDRKKIVINEGSELWPRAKAKREFAQLIAIAFEIAMFAPVQKRRERYYKLLKQLLEL